jgi:hypothetical protein
MRLLKHILLVVLGFALPAFADTNVNTRTLQESLDSIDNWLGALAVSAGATNTGVYLPGTNIVGATYDETNLQWTVSSQTANLLPGTNIQDFTYSNNQWVPPDGYLDQGVSTNYFFAYSDTLQVVTNGVDTLITFSSEYDPNNWFSTNTFTVPYDGLYLLSGEVRFSLQLTPIANRSMLYLYTNSAVAGTFLDREGDNLVSEELNHFSVVRRFSSNTTVQLYRVLDGTITTTNEYRSFSATLLSKD